MEDTVRLYPVLRASTGFMAWIPVFFLYLTSHWSLEQAMLLSAIYYVAVVSLEVPSGHMSDRLGRRKTLMCAAACTALSAVLFVIGGPWSVYVIANIALAGGIALQSGSDTALHFEALDALDRTDEYQHREAQAEWSGMSSMAIAALCGGVLGAVDLRFAYALTGVGAIASLLVLTRMADTSARITESRGFARTLVRTTARLRNPLLAWLFVATVVLYALEGIVFELYQAYSQGAADTLNITALPESVLSGAVICLSMLGGAIAARLSSTRWQQLGLFGLIAVAAAMQAGLVIALLFSSGLVGLALVTTRNFPMSLIHAPLNAVIAPRVPNAERAVFLSIMSLAQRLAFAALMFGLTTLIGHEEAATVEAVKPLLLATLLVASVFVIGLLVYFKAARRAHIASS
ncbi:MAG: MFS transporter [Pseudomonadota bacterium]